MGDVFMCCTEKAYSLLIHKILKQARMKINEINLAQQTFSKPSQTRVPTQKKLRKMKKMFKKTKSITIALLIVLSILIVGSQGSGYAATNAPASLKIYIGPTSVPADNNSYNCIFVQLLDSNAEPARATQDTPVGLSSSITSIGTVQPSVTIPKGSTYASTNFTSTFSPGTTVIAASASGFATVQGSITTVGPIPATVALYGFPSTLPADGNTYNSILVQLQDASGSPAIAPDGGVQVTLSCSNTGVGAVSPTVNIPEGSTYATANFTTVPNNSAIQTAIITSLAQGYASAKLTITTTPVASNPNQLKIFSCAELPADNSAFPLVAVELQNSTGFVSTLSSNTSVTLASLSPTIGQIDSFLNIPADQAYAVATLDTTYLAGSTTITGAATNLLTSQQTITTTGFTPSKLAVFCVPSVLPSDNSTYSAIQVQLQDSEGRPALAPSGDVTVDLFSSTPQVGTVCSTLTIPFGQTQATGTISVTNSPGTTSITAQASSYITGEGSLTTYLIDFLPLQITLQTESQTVVNGQPTNITAYITANGVAVTGATVQFTSDNGGTFTKATQQGDGYTTIFTTPSFTTPTNCTITATASETGYETSQATTQITIGPPTSSTNSTTTQNGDATSNGNSTIRFLVEDSNGSPLSGVEVASTSQPAGESALSGVTNSTGYVVFQNAPAGSYSFSIKKKGYDSTFDSANLAGKPLALTLTLLADSSGSKGGSSLSIILIAVVVVVVAVVVVVLWVKRRSSETDSLPTTTLSSNY